MEKEKLKELLEKEEITLSDVIDAVIELNGIIGVGLISLGDSLKDYCYERAKKEARNWEE